MASVLGQGSGQLFIAESGSGDNFNVGGILTALAETDDNHDDNDLFVVGEDSQEDRYVTFFLGEQTFALSIRAVREIVTIPEIVSVPRQRSYMLGVINLRSEIIPLMDLRLRLGLDARPVDARTCAIIVPVHGRNVGVVVDTMQEVATIGADDVQPAPNIGGNVTKFVQAVGRSDDRVCLILDADEFAD